LRALASAQTAQIAVVEEVHQLVVSRELDHVAVDLQIDGDRAAVQVSALHPDCVLGQSVPIGFEVKHLAVDDLPGVASAEVLFVDREGHEDGLHAKLIEQHLLVIGTLTSGKSARHQGASFIDRRHSGSPLLGLWWE
jgi:hypothetical protein